MQIATCRSASKIICKQIRECDAVFEERLQNDIKSLDESAYRTRERIGFLFIY